MPRFAVRDPSDHNNYLLLSFADGVMSYQIGVHPD